MELGRMKAETHRGNIRMRAGSAPSASKDTVLTPFARDEHEQGLSV